MIQHIMPKGVQVMGHYGLYSRKKVGEIREKLAELFEREREVVQEFQVLIKELDGAQNYRERIKKSFEVDTSRCFTGSGFSLTK